jgi:hypothetical protein
MRRKQHKSHRPQSGRKNNASPRQDVWAKGNPVHMLWAGDSVLCEGKRIEEGEV